MIEYGILQATQWTNGMSLDFMLWSSPAEYMNSTQDLLNSFSRSWKLYMPIYGFGRSSVHLLANYACTDCVCLCYLPCRKKFSLLSHYKRVMEASTHVCKYWVNWSWADTKAFVNCVQSSVLYTVDKGLRGRNVLHQLLLILLRICSWSLRPISTM